MATKNVPDIARDLIMRALDALSDRVPTTEGEPLTPVQRLASSWRSLSPDDRDEVAGYVGATASSLIAALPVAVRAARKRVRQRRRPAVTRAAAPVAETVLPDSGKESKKDKKKKDKKIKKNKKDKKGKDRKKKKDKKKKDKKK